MRILSSFVLFCFIFGACCFGQQKVTDSLDLIAGDNTKDTRIRIDAMIRLSSLYAEIDKDQTIAYSKSAVELSNSLKDAGCQSLSYASLASAYTDSIFLSYALADTALHYLKQVTTPLQKAQTLI
jgi:hypothetical protein